MKTQLWCLPCHGNKTWGGKPTSFGTCTKCGRTGVSRREPSLESRAAHAHGAAYAPHDESTALPAHGPDTPERRALRRILELAEAADEAGDGGDENDEIMHICSGILGE